MDDPRVGTYILVVLAMLVVGGISRASHKTARRIKTMDRAEKSGVFLVFLVLWPVTIVLAGWVDQTLWNMLAPVFGLPQIDLLTSIILGTLIVSLIWSTSGVRTVRIEEID